LRKRAVQQPSVVAGECVLRADVLGSVTVVGVERLRALDGDPREQKMILVSTKTHSHHGASLTIRVYRGREEDQQEDFFFYDFFPANPLVSTRRASQQAAEEAAEQRLHHEGHHCSDVCSENWVNEPVNG